MYFHPWPLVVGMMFLGVSVYAWTSPFVMDGSDAADGMSQFLGRFFMPLLTAVGMAGAFLAPHDALPDNVWLHIALFAAIALEVFMFVRLVRQRRQRLSD